MSFFELMFFIPGMKWTCFTELQ